MRPENAAELAASAAWLLPLLVRATSAEARRALQRLARETPGVLQRLANDPDPGVRRRAAEAIPTPEAPLLRVHTLGPMETLLGDARVDEKAWKTQKIKFLFAYLLAHADRPVPEDRIIDIFWPGDVERGRASLYSATSTIRKAVGADGPRGVVRVGGTLQLDVPRWHDAEEVERALDEARRLDQQGRIQDACGRYRRALSLYRGPFLEACYMDWALERRERLEQAVLAGGHRLAQIALDAGRLAEALEHAHRALEVDPCHQESHLIAMQAHIAEGRPEEAVRQFDRCEKALRRELGMDPMMRLVETYHRARLNL